MPIKPMLGMKCGFCEAECLMIDRERERESSREAGKLCVCVCVCARADLTAASDAYTCRFELATTTDTVWIYRVSRAGFIQCRLPPLGAAAAAGGAGARGADAVIKLSLYNASNNSTVLLSRHHLDDDINHNNQSTSPPHYYFIGILLSMCTQAWTGHCAIVPWHRRPIRRTQAPDGPFEIF